MKRLKEILYRLLYPNIVFIVLSVPVSAALLAYTFLAAGENSPVACVSYVFSAYSLTVVCFNVVSVVKKVRQWLFQNPYISRFFEDIPFRLRITLHLSVGINLLYAGVNAFSGIYYRSPWFGSLAAYYIFLSVMRFLLVRYAHRRGFGENKAAEWRRYRICGMILTMMHVALAGVACYGLCVVFQLVTLPTEFNASHRALRAIEESALLLPEEQGAAKRVLTAAALTYVAALSVTIMQFLRLLLIVAGGNRRRD